MVVDQLTPFLVVEEITHFWMISIDSQTDLKTKCEFIVIQLSGNLKDSKEEIKEQIKEEDDEDGVIEMPEFLTGHKDMYQNTMGEDLMNMKVEGEEEETYVRDDQQYIEEAGMARTFKEEDTPTEIITGCKMEDEDITRDCAGENTMSSAMDGGLRSVDRPFNSPDTEQLCIMRDGSGFQREKTFSCPECGESFSSELGLTKHQISHTGGKLHSCFECGKRFLHKSELVKHCRSHKGNKSNSCPECGKCFTWKSKLVTHQRTHTGEKPYSCPECGKCFSQRSVLRKVGTRAYRKENIYKQHIGSHVPPATAYFQVGSSDEEDGGVNEVTDVPWVPDRAEEESEGEAQVQQGRMSFRGSNHEE
ncbi:zinc finger protein 250-like [Rana temporaria]|uniref:zinc finger protein 250-like n=1 Tax=Rana temporaria TaxID=8407 RepID=UPI001AACD27F|nr:zinc finger protein 250-like [Rana temporaria]